METPELNLNTDKKSPRKTQSESELIRYEFGSSEHINFINAKSYDENGEEIIPTCKCGSTENITTIIGKYCKAHICSDCFDRIQEKENDESH